MSETLHRGLTRGDHFDDLGGADRLLPRPEPFQQRAGLHPDLTHSTSRAALDRAVADLIATIPSATDDELMVGVLRIVAMVSAKGCDAHTGAFVWGTGTYPVESLPLRLWLFPSELGSTLEIVDALPPYQDLIGSTIDRIVIARSSALMPLRHDLWSTCTRKGVW